MSEQKTEKESILKQLTSFYFTNNWYSFFTIIYLLFFLYFSLFFLDNIIVAIKFLFYTLRISTPLLNLSYLFWGTAFIITLIIPFLVNISAIFLLKNIWEKQKLQTKQKFISTIFAIIVIIIIIITMDDIIHNVAQQSYLHEFIQKANLLDRI